MKFLRKPLMYLAVLAFWCSGCGRAAENPDLEKPSLSPAPTAPAVTSVLLAPMQQELTSSRTGLRETIPLLPEPLWEGCHAVNRLLSRNVEDDTSLFCLDEATGVIYFANQNKDWYLYRIRDGRTELAVELPVTCIDIYDGSVYFFVDSRGAYQLSGFSDGDICHYTPATGMVECVYPLGSRVGQASRYRLAVQEDGLHWSYEKSEVRDYNGISLTVPSIFFQQMPFGAAEAEPDLRFTASSGWGDYEFAYLPEWCLQSRLDDTERILLPGNPSFYYVVGDDLYYSRGAFLFRRSLLEGNPLPDGEEEIAVDFTDILQEDLTETKRLLYGASAEAVELEEDTNYLRAFAVTQNGSCFWALSTFSGLHLYCYDSLDGSSRYYALPDNPDLTARPRLTALYTGGDGLYALYQSDRDALPVFVRLDTESGEVNAIGRPVVQLEYLTD